MMGSARDEGEAGGAPEGEVGGDEVGLGGGELEARVSQPGFDRDEFGGERLAGLEAGAGQLGAFRGLADREESDLAAFRGVFATEAGPFMIERKVSLQTAQREFGRA